MASKSLTVLDNDGAGKKTLLGSLIYKVLRIRCQSLKGLLTLL